jgi:hypothetical protein
MFCNFQSFKNSAIIWINPVSSIHRQERCSNPISHMSQHFKWHVMPYNCLIVNRTPRAMMKAPLTIHQGRLTMNEATFNATPGGQVRMYLKAAEMNARADETFLTLVKSGMTKRDLSANIRRRPALWSRYSNWLDKLPD